MRNVGVIHFFIELNFIGQVYRSTGVFHVILSYFLNKKIWALFFLHQDHFATLSLVYCLFSFKLSQDWFQIILLPKLASVSFGDSKLRISEGGIEQLQTGMFLGLYFFQSR